MGIIELAMVLFLLGFIPFILAFIDILKNDFEGSNKLIWLLAVIFVPLIGSIVYFIIGKKQRLLKA
ncbi:MAG TPA: PLD nuclease N-terminal domain-containing protein [Ignavibacteriaceae bacterium]